MFSLKFRQEPLEFLNERMYINTQDEVIKSYLAYLYSERYPKKWRRHLNVKNAKN